VQRGGGKKKQNNKKEGQRGEHQSSKGKGFEKQDGKRQESNRTVLSCPRKSGNEKEDLRGIEGTAHKMGDADALVHEARHWVCGWSSLLTFLDASLTA
jgi:hypothetical protein